MKGFTCLEKTNSGNKLTLNTLKYLKVESKYAPSKISGIKKEIN